MYWPTNIYNHLPSSLGVLTLGEYRHGDRTEGYSMGDMILEKYKI